jgi:hypothetical protein
LKPDVYHAAVFRDTGDDLEVIAQLGRWRLPE